MSNIKSFIATIAHLVDSGVEIAEEIATMRRCAERIGVSPPLSESELEDIRKWVDTVSMYDTTTIDPVLIDRLLREHRAMQLWIDELNDTVEDVIDARSKRSFVAGAAASEHRRRRNDRSRLDVVETCD